MHVVCNTNASLSIHMSGAAEQVCQAYLKSIKVLRRLIHKALTLEA